MNKRRITLNLDADVVEALEEMGGRSVSAVANEALREAVRLHAHRRAADLARRVACSRTAAASGARP